MQKAAAYIRVSTEDQMEYSPDSQLKKIKEYASYHDLYIPDEYIYIDEGISGRTAQKRPRFMKMIAIAKTKPKPFDVILVWKFSRFARNRQDSILYKSMLRKECHIDVISISEQLSDDPTAILIEALLEAMDEYYSINLAEEVKRGMNEKFSRGGVVSIPPFGYCMGNGRFEINSETAPYVKMIYDDFLNDIPYRQIAMKLNYLGIRSNRGNLFENRTIEYILSNPTYIGKLRRNLNGKDKSDRFHRNPDVSLVDGTHEPIIDEITFHIAQLKIQSLKRCHLKYERNDQSDFMLRGLVRCSSCGSTLTKSSGTSLQCHKYARGQCTESHSITMEKLNRAVIAAIEHDFGSEELHIKLKDKVTSSNEISIKDIYNREQKCLERVNAAYEAGIDTLEEYTSKKMNIINRLNELTKYIPPSIPYQKEQITAFQYKLSQLLPMLISSEINEHDKNELLRSMITEIVFDRPHSTIQITYHL